MIYLVQNKTQASFATNYLNKLPIIGVDLETTGLDPIVDKVLLIQIGNEKNQFVFDVARLSEEDLKNIFNVLTNKKILKIFQNGKFDYKMLKSNFGIQVQNISDTMINEQLLTKGVKNKGFNLNELTKKYRAGSPLNKSIRVEFQDMKFGDPVTEEQVEYAANDVRVLPIIYREQLKIVKKKGMLSVFNLENLVVPVMAEMELNGIYINKEKWLSLERAAKSRIEESQIALEKFFEPYFEKDLFGRISLNFNSPLQLKPALEKILGETLENTNEKYLKSFEHPVIDALFEYRGAAKQISTYGEVFLENVHPVTNRIHAKYLQLGTDSGRMSCTNPNMQNIPSLPEYRAAFDVQNENYRIICADYPSQELRVLTQLSKEPTWLKAISEGRDLHGMVASIMFGIPEDQCGKKTAYRDKAKTIGFGTIYGLSPYGLSRDLKIPPEEAKGLLQTFFSKFPEIKAYLDKREKDTLTSKKAVSILDGRIRDLSGIDWDDWRARGHAVNIGKNHPIQGASASITKLALVKIQDYINENKKDAKIIAVIHDEILVESHKDIAEEMSQIIADRMIESFNYYCPDVPMEVSPDIALHWIH